MYEHKHEPLLSRAAFYLRMLRHASWALGIVVGSLAVGVIGYHGIAGFSWIDSILNAAMILGGMGPVNELTTAGGKLFASAYALFAGVVFLVVVGVLFAPAFHRFLHRFHLDFESQEKPSADKGPRSDSSA